jgi:uncharacterized membrane protein
MVSLVHSVNSTIIRLQNLYSAVAFVTESTKHDIEIRDYMCESLMKEIKEIEKEIGLVMSEEAWESYKGVI